MPCVSGADPGFSKRGGGPGAVEVYFDAPSHIPYVFVRRVVNNIQIVNTTCLFAYIGLQ